jgi:hypothetical protein
LNKRNHKHNGKEKETSSKEEESCKEENLVSQSRPLQGGRLFVCLFYAKIALYANI